MTRRSPVPLILLAVLAGCWSGARVATPAAEPARVTAGATATDPRAAAPGGGLDGIAAAEAALADSAADEEALAALAELEVGLDRGAPTLRVAMPVVGDEVSRPEVDRETADLFSGPRGGAASVAGPTYDIDVESFSNHQRVQAYVDFFLGPARDRFEIWLGRLARYEGMVRNRFLAQGVPEDLVYLGLIESGFSNTAVSRAKAVGMWQFIASTARRYGLVVDSWVDERRDPFKGTDAAARHLADLNAEFGSWYLAAAAYNGGAGRVSRGIRRLPGQNDSLSDDTFFQLSASSRYLRRETRDYVPKLIAAALIAKEPARYGFRVTAAAPLAFDEITVSEQTGLDVLADLADTTTAAMMELNPQLFRGVTPPKRTVIVRVPRGAGSLAAQRWAELPANERVTVIEHIVVRGETVSQIARRYRVQTSLVLAANPRVRPTVLRIGQRLIIPVSPTARAAVRRPATTRAAAPVPRPATTRPAARRPRSHTVRWGESLWLIGQRYGVTVAELRYWNDLVVDDVLKAGERLLVAAPVGTAAAAEAAEEDPSP